MNLFHFKEHKAYNRMNMSENNRVSFKHLYFLSANKEKIASDMILPNLLDYISSYEKHPTPDECNGVDYAAIYKALADLMQGEVPAQLNPATRFSIF
jgi:hypothetical protein